MSKVQDNIISRRSIYRFSDRNVENSDLERGFEAARHAPCHKQTHPWKFYIMGEKTRNKIIPIVKLLALKKLDRKSHNDGEEDIKRAISKISDPPQLIAVTTSLSPSDFLREQEDYAASVCALHNFVLSLWEQGIGSQWSTGSITRHQISYDALEISNKNERIIGFLKIGYPEIIPKKVKKPISDVRFYLP